MDAYKKFYEHLTLEIRLFIEITHRLQTTPENAEFVNCLIGRTIGNYSGLMVYLHDEREKEIAELRRKIAAHEAAVAELELRAKHQRAKKAALKRVLRTVLRRKTAPRKNWDKKIKERFKPQILGEKIKVSCNPITITFIHKDYRFKQGMLPGI